ncbi:SpaA isopeptide-forming pilin-related protein [Bacillus sp. 103mf]|uniref:SpaA isopeptide-forming pilin-related protein n=3 Tax=unclassified Bacillus (in: firmicutes) TaxID=185979 RepID=UPI0008E9002A|nr:SpaA isopeptide-forming pilin-related protein [Bacillus sp. 103mf]SFT01499.1 LPXTG-motif cell wall anchor domain-containing protein/TQXA domain-containing protein [Bacillus sp. 103mf]
MKQKMLAKWFSILSVLIILLGVSVPQAKAEIVHKEKYQMKWSYSKSKNREIKAGTLKGASGSIEYCLSLNLPSPNGQDLPEMGRATDEVYRVLLNGYPQKSPVELGVSTPAEAHYATQLAVWIVLGQLQVDDLVPQNQQVHTLMKQLVEKSKHGAESQKVFFNVTSPDSQNVKQNGDYLETGLYTIQTNAVSGTYTIEGENAPAGIQLLNENGEKKTTFSINEKFKILIPKNTASGDFKFKIKSNLTNLQAITFDGKRTIQNTATLSQRSKEEVSTELVVKWETLGSLKVMKSDENKQPLKGAIFEVSNEKGDIKQNITSDDTGVAELHQLPIGTYIVKEVQAPEGYVLDPTIKKVEVQTNETALLEVENKHIQGELEISKVDFADHNKKLSNAEFTIYNQQGQEVSKGITDANGIVTFKLPYGTYTYKETFAPEGYILSENTFSFEIKEDGQIVKHVVENKENPTPEIPTPEVPEETLGSLKIMKFNENKKPLKGAVFEVSNENGDIKQNITSDDTGVAELHQLPIGTYIVKEVQAPEGYVLDPTIKKVEVQTNETALLEVENKHIQGELQISKVDFADQNKKLSNTEFTIYNQQSQEVSKGKTDANGMITFKLPYGTYTYKETLAPEGYILSDNTFSFEIKEDGQIVKHIVKNQKKPILEQPKETLGSLKIMKFDENKKPLKGAIFEVSNEKGDIQKHITSDDAGIAELHQLPIGIYIVKEVQAPEGYVLDPTIKKVNVQTNENALLEVENKRIQGELQISKVDSADDNKKLSNAEFTIYNKQGQEVAKGKTDANGVITFKLPYGTYTYKETLAPEGYILSENTFSFEIKEDGQMIKHTVKNQKKPISEVPNQPKTPDKEMTTNVQHVEKTVHVKKLNPSETLNKEIKPDPQHVEKTVDTKTPDMQHVEKTVSKNTKSLPSTGSEFPILPLLGLGFIMAGIYVFKMRY